MDFSILALNFLRFLSFWLTKGEARRWTRRLPKIKNKNFSYYYYAVIKQISVFQYQYSSLSTVTLPYPNLTWLPSSFGVRPRVRRHKLTLLNRHPLFNKPVTCLGIDQVGPWNTQPLSRHILTIDIYKNSCSLFFLPYILPTPFYCWVAIPGYMACPLLGSSYPAC